jgi:hypothetical protein
MRIALVLRDANQTTRIYLRSLDQLSANALPGTENARDPFFSPDSQWIAFFAEGKMKKVFVQGGAAAEIAFARNFVLHPDGKRFAVFRVQGEDPESRVTKFAFIFNFSEEIRRKFAP